MVYQEEIVDSYSIIAHKSLPQKYLNLVRTKWMRSFRYGNVYIKLTDSNSYFKAYSPYLDRLIYQPQTTVRLAVLDSDQDIVLGFSVTSGNVLHYVFVGKDYRFQGIAKLLVPFDITEFTHLTKTGLKLWSTKAPQAKFNPFQ